MTDVGLLLRESFFCGVENRGVLTCCPREGIINKEQARFEKSTRLKMTMKYQRREEEKLRTGLAEWWTRDDVSFSMTALPLASLIHRADLLA